MRWLLLLLLLVNALTLFWYAVTQTVEQEQLVSDDSVAHIRLVTELENIESDQPVEVDGQRALVGQENSAGFCHWIGRIDNDHTAERLVEFLSQRDIDAYIEQKESSIVVSYQVQADAPDGDGARIRVLDKLSRAGLIPETVMHEGRLLFILRRFKMRDDAEVFLGLLRTLDVDPVVKDVTESVFHYFVRFNVLLDQKMSYKINAIVEKAYPELKITKKAC